MSIVLASPQAPLSFSVFNLNVERRLRMRLMTIFGDYTSYFFLYQDGHAIIWDGFSGQKEVIIQTTTPWVLACSYSPSTTLVACG